MPTVPSPSTVLHRMKPDGYRDNPLVEKLRQLANELQEQTDTAHALLAAIYQPDTGKNDLVDWAEHSPLQLEYFEGKRGDCKLVNIRVRGAIVPSDYLSDALWQEASEFVSSWQEAQKEAAQDDAMQRRGEERRDRAA